MTSVSWSTGLALAPGLVGLHRGSLESTALREEHHMKRVDRKQGWETAGTLIGGFWLLATGLQCTGEAGLGPELLSNLWSLR